MYVGSVVVLSDNAQRRFGVDEGSRTPDLQDHNLAL